MEQLDCLIHNCIARVMNNHQEKHGCIRNAGVLQKKLTKELLAVMKPARIVEQRAGGGTFEYFPEGELDETEA